MNYLYTVTITITHGQYCHHIFTITITHWKLPSHIALTNTFTHWRYCHHILTITITHWQLPSHTITFTQWQLPSHADNYHHRITVTIPSLHHKNYHHSESVTTITNHTVTITITQWQYTTTLTIPSLHVFVSHIYEQRVSVVQPTENKRIHQLTSGFHHHMTDKIFFWSQNTLNDWHGQHAYPLTEYCQSPKTFNMAFGGICLVKIWLLTPTAEFCANSTDNNNTFGILLLGTLHSNQHFSSVPS